MAKVLNQLLYSSIVYGSDQPSGTLRLTSTSSGMKGQIEFVGSHFDLITDNQTARLWHTNNSTRLYKLPDISGEILVSGLFTEANQLLYSASAGVYATLSASLGGSLVTNSSGSIQWATGQDGQILMMVSGSPSFQSIPDVGTVIAASNANQIPYYAEAGNVLSPMTTVSNRAFLSVTGGGIGWSLISATYLKALGNTALGVGLSSQLLSANGDGTFAWVNPNAAVINPGTQYRLPYYSGASPGTAISESLFISTDETAKALSLRNRGVFRLHEADAYGTSYLELKAPTSLPANVSWILPQSDGLNGAVLTTDGVGNLTFVYTDNGSVANGLANQLAYYSTSGNDVVGLTTTSARILGSTSLGALSWLLISPTYLSAVSGALGQGNLNQVLTSTGTGFFAWATATDITGEVLSGVATHLAYYATTGKQVDDVSFLTVDPLGYLNLLTGSSVRLYNAAGTNYVGVAAPTSITTSFTLLLPPADGLSGDAIVTDGAGNLSFLKVGRGVVHTGTAKTLAYYDTAVNEVYPWTNVAERAALTSADNEIVWELITDKYLAAPGNSPLDTGESNQVLVSDGFGAFQWANASDLVGRVSAGQATRLSYYTATNTVAGSGWLNNSELQKALELLGGGTLRLYEVNSTFYAALSANPAALASVQWYLPAADATSANQALISNGLGSLSFQMLVDTGSSPKLAYYTAANTVAGSGWIDNNEDDKALELFDGGSLRLYEVTGTYYASLLASSTTAASVQWYLPAVDATAANQALVSDSAGNLSFITLVEAGVQDAVATYQNGTTPKVSPSANFFNDVSGLLLKGALFTITGDTSTVVKINSASGNSVILGAATDDIVSLDPGKWFSILYGSTLRWFDSETNYLGFIAPEIVPASTIWTLPPSDGSLGQCISTDGDGNLGWVDIVATNIQNGTVGAFAYYSNTTEISGSSILIPSGLPATTLSSFVVDKITGQVSYKMLVTPSATIGNVGVYVDDQTIGYFSTLNWDNANVTLQLGSNGKLELFNTLNSKSVKVQAAAALAANLTLTLPSTLPATDYYSMVGTTTGVLSFKQLVTPAGAVGNIGYYTAEQTIGYSANLNWDNSTKLLTIGSNGALVLFNSANTKSVTLSALAALTDNIVLTLPSSLPAANSYSVIGTTDGILSFKQLVTPGATAGNLGVYTAEQTVGYYSNLNWVDGTSTLQLGDTGKLQIFDSGNARSITIVAPAAISSSYSITLPTAPPATDYYAIVSKATGELSFRQFVIPGGTLGNIGVYTADQTLGYFTDFNWDDTNKLLSLGTNGSLVLYNAANTKFVSLSAAYGLANDIDFILPSGLPSANYESLVSTTTGTLSFKQIVTTGATAGYIGFYTAEQTIGYSSDFTWDDATKLFTLGSNGTLEFTNALNTRSITIHAASDLNQNLDLTLPKTAPGEGYLLYGEPDGTLAFVAPSGDTRWEKRGVITLSPSIRSVTVLYDEPFTSTPAGVQVQWITSSGNLSYLPTYAVERSTAEGFIVRFSTNVPSTGTYKLYWQSHLTAVSTPSSNLYLVCGETSGGGFLPSIYKMVFDLDTNISSATTITSRGYAASGGSSTLGFIFGGETTGNTGLASISSFSYATDIASELLTSLSDVRSGGVGVGTRSVCYVAGGEAPGGNSSLSIEAFNTSTETVSTILPELSSASIRKGAATSITKGGLVDDSGAVVTLTYATEILASLAVSLSTLNVSVGANDVNAGLGYFGNDTGEIDTFSFLTNTISALGVTTLNSTSGLSSAGNSLDKAYFSGDTFMESLSFTTGALSLVASLPQSGLLSASASTFQSKGLL